jgi:preprotein translocase subunit SecA
MERFKLPEDQPMEAKILSNQIEGAQKKVEEQNFVARKNVLKYDDVMNVQRQEIYAQRRRVLEGEDMSDFVLGWIDEVIERTVANYTETEYGEEWDLDALVGQLHALYGTDITVDELREDGVDLADRDALVEEFRQDARDVYEEKNEQFGLNPDTDAPLLRDVERYVILQIVDRRWREHLENMEYLREGIHLRSMAQKDPLTEYRHEGHLMFEDLSAGIREEVVLTLFHAELAPEAREEVAARNDGRGAGNGDLQYEHEVSQGADAIASAGDAPRAAAVGAGASTAVGGGGGSVATAPKATTPDGEKIGRNDPCWCGSGKKFKKCHGA